MASKDTMISGRGPNDVSQDEAAVQAITLESGTGISATILTLGSTLQALYAPDRHGRVEDIVLGHDEAASYAGDRRFFGSTVGRYANRIAHGRFMLDGETFQLARNDGAHHLHGGDTGFDRRPWRIDSVDTARLVLSLDSPDGDDGYPGRLQARCEWRLDADGSLTIDLSATTSRPTIVNLTNHAFFNLSGGTRSALDHRLTLWADGFTPVDEGLIPTGEIRPVADTPFDFRTAKPIARDLRDGRDEQIRRGRGYDHNFVLRGERGLLRPAARLEDPESGRRLDIATTEAGLQLYSGNFLDGTALGKRGRIYRQGDGVCLEPQTWPDAPNHPDFPSARLEPGEVYRHTIVLSLSTFPQDPARATP